jgi:hypothetical protein
MNIVTENRNVLLRLDNWRPRFIQSEIDDLEVDYIVPPVDSGYVRINDTIEIIPINNTIIPEYDKKYKELAGPYYMFDEADNIVTAKELYIDIYLPIDTIKQRLKDQITSNRYDKENYGCKTVIQNTEVFIDTSRGNRDIFIQKYILMSDDEIVLWKFPEAWLNLTKPELGQIVYVGGMYIQSSFVEESTKCDQVDACTTIEELEAIIC